ncbi:hypothetical protein AAF712_010708 [Marasmius tenuissimus]|uniref:Uncharacterized protein n=1 Tax=Marasmius tenuissimus TaxID=585030 RepID=A0ABR2ZN66_9AGAR
MILSPSTPAPLTHHKVYLIAEVQSGQVNNALASIKKAPELTGKDTYPLLHLLSPLQICWTNILRSMMSLPSVNGCGVSRTARELYLAIKHQYGLGNSAVFKTTCNALYATTAEDVTKVSAYTEHYQKQALTLARASDNLDWSDVIHHFAAHLPDSPVISDLKYRLINAVAVQHCSVNTFKIYGCYPQPYGDMVVKLHAKEATAWGCKWEHK